MQTAMPSSTTRYAGDGDSFTGVRWNGWLIVIIAVVCIFGFVVVQLMLTVFIILRDNPDILRFGTVSPDMQRKLTDPTFIIGFLNAKNLWLLSVLSEGVLVLGTVVLVRIMLGATTRALGFRGWPAADRIAVGLAMGLVLFVVSSALGALLTKLFGPHPQPQALALAKHHGLSDFLLDFMSVSVAAPLAEETFFRGFIFAALVQRLPFSWAALISAGLFGFAHLEKWSFLPIFAIGLGLAWLYYRTRNLWVNIIAHGTVNAVSLILAFTVPKLVNT